MRATSYTGAGTDWITFRVPRLNHGRRDALSNCAVMLVLGVTAETISSLATATGTLVLAIATFSAVRSAGRSARIAEMALQEQRRPILTNSRLADPEQKLMFSGGHWVNPAGGHATAEHIDGIVYLSISLRNVGNGIAVCQAWTAFPQMGTPGTKPDHAPEAELRPQSRDLYIPPGDIGMWQGALRSPEDPLLAEVAAAIDAGEPVGVELLYSDQIGGQRTITRFGLLPAGESRLASMTRHWHLDWSGPRETS
jgi:hypothetical protein